LKERWKNGFELKEMWRNNYELKERWRSGYELKKRWRSGYELKKMVYFQKQLHKEREFIFKFSYIKKGSLFSKSEFIFKISCINKGSKEREKNIRENNKEDKKEVLKKKE